MTSDDRAALRELMNGAAFGVAVLGMAAILVAILIPGGETPDERTQEQKFQVVDKYKGCEVVRYTDRSNSWHYFLDCNDKRTN